MALVATPTYPVVGEEITLSLTATTGTVSVYEVVSRPALSARPLGLVMRVLPTGVRVATAPDDAAGLGLQTDRITFDEPGEYLIRAYDLRHVQGVPSYLGDPAGDEWWQVITTQTGTVHVGAYMDLPILTAVGHGATLRLTINNEVIRDADLLDTTTEVARVACLDTAVVAALATIIGLAPSTVGTQIIDGVNDLRTKYAAHRVLVGAGPCHSDTDTTNVVGREASYSLESALALLENMRSVILAHAQVTGVGGGLGLRWHPAEDWANIPVAGSASDLASGTVAMIDLRERFYERHRALLATSSPPSHTVADVTNVLTAALPLDTLIVALLDAIVALDPSAVAGEAEGAADLAHRFGFTMTRTT